MGYSRRYVENPDFPHGKFVLTPKSAVFRQNGGFL